MNPKGWSPLHGIICLWHGAAEDIPDGWVLCDGQNGTPDMRGRWACGAKEFRPVGFQFGTWSHTHHFDTKESEHTHAGITEFSDSELFEGDYIPDNYPDGQLTKRTYEHMHTLAIEPNIHTHPCKSGYAVHAPTSTSLHFIMKL